MSSKFPYKVYRKGQEEVAENVKETVKNSEILLLEAPTGFGKTAAVIEGLERGGAEKVLWVVRTVNQIEPVLRELRRFGLSYTYVFSARRSCPLVEGSDIPVEDFWVNCRHLRSQARCSFYLNTMEGSVEYLQSLLNDYKGYTATETASLLAKMDGLCPFFSLLRLAGHSKYVVATYPYLFKWDLFTHVLDIGDYSDLALVVDEAHSILGIHSIYEYKITVDIAEKSLDEARKYTDDESLVERLEVFSRLLQQKTTSITPGIYPLDKTQIIEVLGDPEQLAYTAEVVREVMLEEKYRTAGLQGVMKIVSGITKLATWLATLSMESSKLYIEWDGEEPPEFVATPMDPAEIASPIIQGAQSAVLMSGTLPPGNMVGDFLGIDRTTMIVDVDAMYGPVMPLENKYTILGIDVSTRYSERGPFTYKIYAGYISSITTSLPGAKLVVYPSYDVLYSVIERIDRGEGSVVESKKTSIAEVVRRLEDREDLVIHSVAGGKLVEGVEYVDENGRSILKTVVVIGVPYPQPTPYTQDYIEALAKRIGARKAREYTYHINASIKVRQALGRAIRSREDRAVYFLLDHRYNNRKLRNLLKMRIDEMVTYNKITFPTVLEKARKHLETEARIG
ncbi:MAG: ATP-dependent DNA helicase [Desulfurococcales archaeon]|nr:ATP-dependent DNA helicase [Desulfurococcales archaeon]